MTSIQSVPALVAGLLLIVAGLTLWLALSRAAVTKDLLAKLPEDSRIAGVARLAAFDYGTVGRTSASAKVYPAETKALVAAVRKAVPAELLGKALGSEVGFARTRDDQLLAVATVRDEAAYAQVATALNGVLEDPKRVEVDTPEHGRLAFSTGRLPGTKVVIRSHRDGRYVYFSTHNGQILAAVNRTVGFDRHPDFAEVSGDLPGAEDAYVFLDGSLAEGYPRLDYSLVGLAIENDDDVLRIETANARPPRVQETLGRTAGKLLPPVSAAPVSVSGTDALAFLRLLEEQRSEEDLPGVLRFQNGVSALNRQLGVDVERDYLAAAGDRFVYARYQDGDTRHWMGLLEFDSPETARAKTEELQGLLKAKAKVPVRREVVKVLPDGTESREIESQRDEPLSIGTVTVEGRPAAAARLPEMGRAVWQVRDRYLLIGSSEEAVARLVRTLAEPDPADAKGQLAVRIALGKVASVTGKEDGLFTWLLFIRPERGSFTLDKGTGVLTGGLTFAER